MSMTEAHPPNPSQSKETIPFTEGKSEHLTVPSWNPPSRFCSEVSFSDEDNVVVVATDSTVLVAALESMY